jgi:hypothetical protein
LKAAIFGAVVGVHAIFRGVTWTRALTRETVSFIEEENARGAILHRRRVARPPVAYAHRALIVVDAIFGGVTCNGAAAFGASALSIGIGVLSAKDAILYWRRAAHAVGARAHRTLVLIIARSAIVDGRVFAPVFDPCVVGTLVSIVAFMSSLAFGNATGSTIATRAAASSRATTAASTVSLTAPNERHHAERADT